MIKDTNDDPTPQPEKRRWAATGLIALFSTALLSVWLIPGNASEAQNRLPLEFPVFSGESAADPATYRGVDAALRDRIGAQVVVAHAIGNTSVHFLRRSPTSEVTLAADGQPFLTEDMTRPCRESEASLNVIREQLAADAGAFEAVGKYVMYVVAPDKSSIRQNDVNAISPNLLRCSNFVRDHFEDWSEEGGLPLITLWDELKSLDSTPEQAYMFNDTHWNANGATAMTRAVFQKLVDDGQAPAAILDTLENPILGKSEKYVTDMNGIMGVTDLDERAQSRYERSGVVTTGETTTAPTGAKQLHFTSTSTGEPLIPGRTLFLGDSFLLTQLTTQVPNFFEDVTIADHHEYAQAGEFDRVIVERVQRYATTEDWPPLTSTLK